MECNRNRCVSIKITNSYYVIGKNLTDLDKMEFMRIVTFTKSISPGKKNAKKAMRR